MMNSTIKQYCGFGSGMGNNQDPGSGINIPDPQYCNKVYLILRFLFFSPCRRIVVILEQRIGAAGGLSALISTWQMALFTNLGPTLIKKKIKFPSYVRKFRMEQLQSHIWLTAFSYKYLAISSYVRTPFLIYDFVTAPLLISLYMKKNLHWQRNSSCTGRECHTGLSSLPWQIDKGRALAK